MKTRNDLAISRKDFGCPNHRHRDFQSKFAPASNTYKIRRDHAPPIHKSMELERPEFLRRFCLHVPPERFVKIRHYGLLANRGRQERVAQAKGLLGVEAPKEEESELESRSRGATETGETPRLLCPYCGKVALVSVEMVSGPARAPPNQVTTCE